MELAVGVDREGLAEAFAAHGLVLEQEGDRLEARYAAEEAERLAEDVRRALDDWIAARGLPLVPTDSGDGAVALRPPAG